MSDMPHVCTGCTQAQLKIIDLAKQLEALTEYFEASEELSKFIALSEKDRRHEGHVFKSQARLKKARKAIAALPDSEVKG